MAQYRRTFFSLGGPTRVDDPGEREAEARRAGQRAERALGLQQQQIQNQLMLGQQEMELRRAGLTPGLDAKKQELESRRLEHQMKMDPLRFQLEREKLEGGGMAERKMKLEESKFQALVNQSAQQFGLSEKRVEDAMTRFRDGQAQIASLKKTSDELQKLLQGRDIGAVKDRQAAQITAGTAGRKQTIEGARDQTQLQAGISATEASLAHRRVEGRDEFGAATQELMSTLDQKQKVAFNKILETARKTAVIQAQGHETKERKARALDARTGAAEQIWLKGRADEKGRKAARKAARDAESVKAVRRAGEEQRGYRVQEEARTTDYVRKSASEERAAVRQEAAEGRADWRVAIQAQGQLRIAEMGAANNRERLKLQREQFAANKDQFGLKYAQSAKQFMEKQRTDYTAREAETEQYMIVEVGKFAEFMRTDPDKRELDKKLSELLAKAASADRSLGNVSAKGKPIPSGIYRFALKQLQEQAGKELLDSAEPGAWQMGMAGEGVYGEWFPMPAPYGKLRDPKARLRAMTQEQERRYRLSGEELPTWWEQDPIIEQEMEAEELKKFRARRRKRR